MDYINHFLVHQNKQAAHRYIKSKYNVKVSYNTMGKILLDTKICGFYRGNPEYCEPYVDADTFEKIQELLKKNIKTTKTNKIYIFSGLIKCPVCNRILIGTCSNKRTLTRANGKSYTYTNEIYSYRCNNQAINKTCTYIRRPNEKK